MLTVKIEAYCLSIEVDRHTRNGHVKSLLKRLITTHGRP